MSRPADQDCATCRFWDNIPLRDGSPTHQGHCKRRAPVIYSATYVDGLDRVQSEAQQAWPVTGEADWCGEFEQSPPIAAGDALLVGPKCATCQDGTEPPPLPKMVTADGRCPDCGEYTIPF